MYIKGAHYCIQSVETLPFALTFFPLKDVIYVKSYEHYGKISHVFVYKVNYNDFVEWVRCWVHIATNIVLSEEPDGSKTIKTHVYDYKIKNTIANLSLPTL